MRKIRNGIRICVILGVLAWAGGIVSQRQQLNDELVRLHVVGASDSAADQSIKLQVKDAVVSWLKTEMEEISDPERAKAYLQENLPKIQAVAEKTLQDLSCDAKAICSLGKEVFPVREYDTFTLPAGVYDALRIVIGSGEGKNWWCVVFPSLCMPATSEGFADVAAGAGFSDSLTAALEGKEGYELRFFLLDLLGNMENIFFRG